LKTTYINVTDTFTESIKFAVIPLICFFLLIVINPLSSKEYFLRLNENGLSIRKSLLSGSEWLILSKNSATSLQFFPVISNGRYQQQFNNWLLVSIPDSDEQAVLAAIKEQSYSDILEPVGYFEVNSLGNDSLINNQWYLEKIKIADAWQQTMGSENIIIGIIDTGIDYNHPDLKHAMWINITEDINGNGELDADDINNIDDDGNGFIDDVMGWDFTDAPRFIDGGDYAVPDNDPMDDYPSGHGTQIAGIIAAEHNNVTGISGVSPGVRIMNLRAGTASGYLEEDDVARAVLYALDNGVRILNMSFGDVVLSRFLKDVITYAYSKGMIIVASAGNEATDRIHYPSGLSETISVGASNENDQIAGFSNYGNTIDLLAPGTNMLSTAPGNRYNSVQGTSFSAPVVSAVCGLILSNEPAFESEQVRNILKTSAFDILYEGWDLWSGAGRVMADRAVQTPHGGILRFDTPVEQSSTAEDTLWITGTAIHPDLASVRVDFGTGQNPDSWTTILDKHQHQVYRDTIGSVDLTTIDDTLLTVRLRISMINNHFDEARVLVHVDRSAPIISDINILPMYDDRQGANLISFNTDDICRARIYIRPQANDTFSEVVEAGYETNQHRIKIDQSQVSGSALFYIEVINMSGMTSVDSAGGAYYVFNNDANFEWNEYYPLSWELPAGYFFEKTTDFDADGKKEFILSHYNEHHAFGKVGVYEFETDHFELRLLTDFPAIPRDAGDVDGDGLSDLLLGYGILCNQTMI